MRQVNQTDCDFAIAVVRRSILMGLTSDQVHKLIDAAWGVIDVSADRAADQPGASE